MVDLDAQRDTAQGSFLYESRAMQFSSPLFATLARGCAEDQEILELCAGVRRGQPIALFVMLVVQYLLFRSPDEELAGYFPSMTDRPKPMERAFPVFRAFCLERRSQLRELLATRTVNTNLVERASNILPALHHVHAVTGEPLTLVEICCSAGFNLLFDEYYYDYGAAGRIGKEDAGVRLSCKVIRGSKLELESVPPVAQRVGVDLVTVDCRDPEARLWMEAMVHPEWHAERDRLKKALALRSTREIRMLSGNALEVLPDLLEELAGPVAVLHTYCMGQWFAAAQEALDKMFRYASRQRDIHRIGVEVPGTEPSESIRARLAALSRAKIPISQKSLPARVDYTQYRKGTAESTLLAYVDGFGGWLDWRAAA
jgi:hypothetical protein